MKEPKPITKNCRQCSKPFLAKPYECWEYNENGDDKFDGYSFADTCDKCRERWSKIDRKSREWGEWLYKDGLITSEELNNRWPI